jgi:hypothetical protein
LDLDSGLLAADPSPIRSRQGPLYSLQSRFFVAREE